MNYQEAMAFMEASRAQGSKLGLSTLNKLLSRLSHPERCLKFIHVAGTNGKGSTCAFTASILKTAGYRVGLFASPAVNGFNEQIQVFEKSSDTSWIADEMVARHLTVIKKHVEAMVLAGEGHPTEFEILTAMAFLHFKEVVCDFILLEVGLGGLTDATNVIETPLVAAITPVAMDHMNFLGNTLTEIATMKAGIIKPEGITVTGEQDQEVLSVIEKTCVSNHNELVKVRPDVLVSIEMSSEALKVKYQNFEISLGLRAPYQVQNAKLAVTIVEVLIAYYHYPITHRMIIEGLENAFWPSRFEIISSHPITIIDGAHNLHGIKALKKAIEAYYEGYRIVGVIGMLADKDIDGMLNVILPALDEVVATKSNNPRSLSADDLGCAVKVTGKGMKVTICPNVEDAIMYCEQFKDEKTVVIYFGSLYYLGEVKARYRK